MPRKCPLFFFKYGRRIGATFELLVKADASQRICAESMVSKIVVGTLNSHHSVSVSAPHDVAELKGSCGKAMMLVVPGVFSRSTLVKSQHLIEPTSGKTAAQEKVKHRVSGLVQKTGKDRKVAKVALQESGGFIKRVIVLTM